jgi:hypothetical protein
MSKDDLKLYPEEASELLRRWHTKESKYSIGIEDLLVHTLRKLESVSLRNYQAPVDKNNRGILVQDALAASAGESAEFIESQLQEMIRVNLEIQRATPEKIRADLIEEFLHVIKMLATECFVAGVVAGEYNLLPLEKDFSRAKANTSKLKKNNQDKIAESVERAQPWIDEANRIIEDLFSRGRFQLATNKSHVAREVIRKLKLSVSEKTVKRFIDHLF